MELAISPDATLAEAVRALAESDLLECPVVDARGSIVGVLSARALLACFAEAPLAACSPAWRDVPPGPLAAESHSEWTHHVTVAELMTPPPLTCEPATDLRDVLARMERERRRTTLVLCSERICGVVDEAALRHWIRTQLEAEGRGARAHECIERTSR